MKNPFLPVNEFTMAQGAADALARAGFSRRTFIKGTGALIVSFSMGGALGTLEAQTRAGAFGLDAAPDSPPPRLRCSPPHRALAGRSTSHPRCLGSATAWPSLRWRT